MNQSWINSSYKIRQRVLELLWRQWTTLGVAGTTRPVGSAALIDPEALLLTSTTWARWDARLFDEILDWLEDHADWINLQRLTRMQAETQLGTATVLSAIASRLSRKSTHHKWKALASKPPVNASPEPLFLGEGSGHFGPADDDFQNGGWLRAPIRYRGLASDPRTDHPANLLLKLRALFGRQSRAEVMAWLLTHESGHPAQIARETGYFARSVQLTLNELERSGHVFARRVSREKQFSLRHEQWAFLCSDASGPNGFPRWLGWPTLFQLLESALPLLSSEAWLVAETSVQSIELKQTLDFGSLAGSGVSTWLSHPITSRGPEAVQDHLDRLEALLTELTAFSA